MKSVVIDVGNTFTKLAVVNADVNPPELENVEKFKTDENLISEIESFFENSHIEPKSAVISSVVPYLNSGVKSVSERFSDKVEFFRWNGGLGIKTHYRFPERLGADRLASIYAVSKIFPDKDVLICSFGTAVVVDLVKKGGEHIGGFITPGFELMLKSLYSASLLKGVKGEPQIEVKFGRTTEECISYGLSFELKEFLEGVFKLAGYPVVVFSGGGADFWKEVFPQAVVIKNLVLYGLAYYVSEVMK